MGTPGWSMAQEEPVSTPARSFSGAVSVTNKGISTIPTFTLGKPAATFDLSLAGRRLSFEPQLRFNLVDGRPWVFLLWWRYKVLQADRVRLHVGAHPAFSFRMTDVEREGSPSRLMEMRRFLASEVLFTYQPSRHVSIGPYYLYSHGVDPTTTRNTHFIALNIGLHGMPLTDKLSLSILPQLYFLSLGGVTGTYITSRAVLATAGVPISLSAMFNQSINTDIAGDPFIWNVSATYAFGL
ncbi:MAG: hypothetical protein SH809_02945 [Rhodothermales bacterium]|nr:hypothetical protein [Rhodothermales bacterium]